MFLLLLLLLFLLLLLRGIQSAFDSGMSVTDKRG